MANNSILNRQYQLMEPGSFIQHRHEVETVIEYCLALRTCVPQYKVRWLGNSLEDNQWIHT